MAMPLSEVDRLEEINVDRIERAGEQEVIQYRGQILPLIRPQEHLPERRRTPREPVSQEAVEREIQVVVYSHEGGSYGLVVDSIEDIADESVTVKREGTRDGILGVIVIQCRTEEDFGFHVLYGFSAAFAVAIIYSYRNQLAEKVYLLYGLGGLFIAGLGLRAMSIVSG